MAKCMKCGGTKKMEKGGATGIVGMPKYGNNPRTQTGAMLETGGATKMYKTGGPVKSLPKAQFGKSVNDSVRLNTMHPNFSYDTASPLVFKKPVPPIVPKKPQTGKGSGMGRMYMDDMSNPLSEQKKGGPVKKYEPGGSISSDSVGKNRIVHKSKMYGTDKSGNDFVGKRKTVYNNIGTKDNPVVSNQRSRSKITKTDAVTGDQKTIVTKTNSDGKMTTRNALFAVKQKIGGSIKYKTGGMVNANAKIAAAKKATCRVGGTSKVPKKAVPKAKYGMTMMAGGMKKKSC